MSARSLSGGATSSAAHTRAVWAECAAQAATSRQPRLCATSTAGAGPSSSTSSSRAIQSPRRGQSQSSCSTRWWPCSASQRLCQCAGPEFCQPGNSSTRGAMASGVMALAYPPGYIKER